MYYKALQIIHCFALISSQISLEDYFMDHGLPTFQRTKDIRRKFIENKKRINETAKRIQLLDKYLPKNIVYLDDIAHYAINKTNSQWKRVSEIETEFRNIIGMKGLKYTYKRDMFWRTWRQVRYPENKRVICYRCENTVNFTNCQNGGYWVIEERPPCPYELFSLSREDKICAVHLNQYNNVNNSCTSEISISDLTWACNNPIVTEWRIEKLFNAKASERFPSVICGGRESCSISTLYQIAADNVSFRIVNATNDVIYSRIMKNNKKNYACIKDCGKMDSNTKKISKTEKSLIINLLGNKNKREDNLFNRNKQRTKYFKTKINKMVLEKYQDAKYIFDKNLISNSMHPLTLSLVQDEMDEDFR